MVDFVLRPSISRALFLTALLLPRPAMAGPEALALRHQRIDLPGVPVVTLSVDLDRDGRRDLAVVVASTSWGEVGFEEPMQVDDEGTFVDVLTVVPTLLDRRELRLYMGVADGFSATPRTLELPSSVHALAAGPPSAPLLAWTDDGVSEVVLEERLDEGGRDAELALVPRVVAPTLFAGSESFLGRTEWIVDLDGDGDLDLFVPVRDGLAVYLSDSERIETERRDLVAPPAFDERLDPAAEPARAARHRRSRVIRADIALPRVLDLNGDRRPDLLYRGPAERDAGVRVRLGDGTGRFGPAFDPLPDWSAVVAGARTPTPGGKQSPKPEVVWFGDLDGDGAAEVLTSEEIASDKETMRAELAEAKRPRARIRVHSLGSDGRWEAKPKAEFVVEGYVFEGGDSTDDGGDDGDREGLEIALPSGVRDLDGDGRLDFVALTLDFSLFEAMRVLTTHSLKLGLDFAVYRQSPGFVFHPVPDLDLAGELRLRLDSLSIGQLSSFASDFDGDGRVDFVQMGRGRKVTIHRGQDGAKYAPKPDLAVTLEREPADVALVSVADLDGDGKSDLAVTQPIRGQAVGSRAALELYLSRGSR